MADEDQTTPSTDVAPSQLRASHEDRDRIVELLRVSAGDGRLTAEELDERLEAALTARTYGELALLVADLPPAGTAGTAGATGTAVAPAASAAAASAAAAKAKDLVRIECRSSTVNRDGSWVVPRRIDVRLTSGSVVLDFTDAVITQPVLRIDAEIRSGTLRLITKPGIVADADEVAVRSGHVKVNPRWDHDAPEVFRIEIAGKVTTGTIVAGPPSPPRRTFWQWLARRPRPVSPYELTSS